MRVIDADALKENLQNHYGVVGQDCGVSKDFVDGTFMGLDAAMFEIYSAHTIDAIPVEWLREWQDEVGTLNEWWPIIERIITVWHEEQEARQWRTSRR